MLGLTLVKYSSDSMKTVPIVRLMMRDGTLTFLLVTREFSFLNQDDRTNHTLA